MFLLTDTAVDAASQALVAASIAAAGTCVLASSMFVAYAARKLNRWRTLDGDASKSP